MQYVIDLESARPVQSKDGLLTKYGTLIAGLYARRWVHDSVLDLVIERAFHDLQDFFYDLLFDIDLADVYAKEG